MTACPSCVPDAISLMAVCRSDSDHSVSTTARSVSAMANSRAALPLTMASVTSRAAPVWIIWHHFPVLTCLTRRVRIGLPLARGERVNVDFIDREGDGGIARVPGDRDARDCGVRDVGGVNVAGRDRAGAGRRPSD